MSWASILKTNDKEFETLLKNEGEILKDDIFIESSNKISSIFNNKNINDAIMEKVNSQIILWKYIYKLRTGYIWLDDDITLDKLFRHYNSNIHFIDSSKEI